MKSFGEALQVIMPLSIFCASPDRGQWRTRTPDPKRRGAKDTASISRRHRSTGRHASFRLAAITCYSSGWFRAHTASCDQVTMRSARDQSTSSDRDLLSTTSIGRRGINSSRTTSMREAWIRPRRPLSLPSTSIRQRNHRSTAIQRSVESVDRFVDFEVIFKLRRRGDNAK